MSLISTKLSNRIRPILQSMVIDGVQLGRIGEVASLQRIKCCPYSTMNSKKCLSLKKKCVTNPHILDSNVLNPVNFSSVRHCSNENQNASVKGFVMRIPNPINWIRNYFSTFKIRQLIDKDFTLEAFGNGAKQAACVLSTWLSSQNFTDMKGLVSDQTVEKLKTLTSDWSDYHFSKIALSPGDIQLVAPNVLRVFKIDGVHHIDIDTFFLAMKQTDTTPLMIEITLRFSCICNEDKPSHWTISDIGHFRVKDFMSIGREE